MIIAPSVHHTSSPKECYPTSVGNLHLLQKGLCYSSEEEISSVCKKCKKYSMRQQERRTGSNQQLRSGLVAQVES